jgi:hypothetical protein
MAKTVKSLRRKEIMAKKAMKRAAANVRPSVAPAPTGDLAESMRDCLISPGDSNVAEGLLAIAQAISGLAREMGKLRQEYAQQHVQEEPDEVDEESEYEEADEEDAEHVEEA